jgi:ribonuclease P protein component
VARRLRHLVRDRLAGLPEDSLLVVRALPRAASATSLELGEDLDAGLRSALRKRGPS